MRPTVCPESKTTEHYPECDCPAVGGYLTAVAEYGYMVVSLPLTGEGE